MNKNTRVRFSPSPSGYLHIGGVRTALFNWLWARKNNGKMILRIEDTDQARSTPESYQVILDSLKWLGLNWDEGPEVGGNCGPYTQMERLDKYQFFANKLISEGKAYKCFCSKEDLDVARSSWKEKYGDKVGFKYPGTCRSLKERPENKEFVIRLKCPTDGIIVYTDKVFGKISTPNKENQDIILMRSDGIPLYNFGAVCDDVLMGVTLVARGRDHMVNMLPQLLIYDALGATIPEFVHLPMMLNESGKKLSKRDGAVGVFEYRDAGYTPNAVINYLVRFGWASGNKEVFSLNELIDAFSWEACGRGDGKFDVKKFAAIQFEHLKNPALTSDDEYMERLIPFLEKKGIRDIDHARIRAALPLVRPRAHTLVEAAEEIFPFICDEINEVSFKDISVQIKEKVHLLLSELDSYPAWNEDHLRQLTKDWLTKHNLTLKELGGFMRLSLTGRPNSPELFQVMATLGRGRSLKRLQIGVEHLGRDPDRA